MIHVKDVEMRYGSVNALRGVSFSVPAGQVCGYLGPNGAGKTTTLKILAGILKPTAGTATVAGCDVATQPLEAKRSLGFVPESGSLYTLLSVQEHLNLVADLYGMEQQRAADRIQQLVQRLELSNLRRHRIDSLSKGQRQRVAIACGLLHEPQVVLMDEPLDGLDVRAARSVRDLINELAGSGRTVIYSSHILDVVERTCDRVIILHQGHVVADGFTDALMQQHGARTLEAVFHALTSTSEQRQHA